METRPVTTGLKWRKRKGGPDVPYWFADPKAIEAGYPTKSANLAEHAHNPVLLVERCEKLQSNLLAWIAGYKKDPDEFDGSFKTLLELYQTHPKSPFKTSLKHGTVKIYTIYLKRLIEHIGHCQIDDTDGCDVMQWFDEWRVPMSGPIKDQLSVALMVLAVLKAAISFGIICRKKGCVEFQAVLGELEFEALRRRTQAPTADQIIAARKAAHANGAPLRALLYALQFETTARQWDFIGQWLPLSDKKPSAIIDSGKKWVGPMWSWIDQNLILNMTPTKTEDTTAVEVWFDLSVCPMVMEELALLPEKILRKKVVTGKHRRGTPAERELAEMIGAEKKIILDPEAKAESKMDDYEWVEIKKGPLIINERTGLPYSATSIVEGWHRDFKAADLPEKMWNRDFRAGGISEGSKAGASRDDRKTVAGHAREETTEGYERGLVSLEAHRRTAAKRAAFRSAGNATKT